MENLNKQKDLGNQFFKESSFLIIKKNTTKHCKYLQKPANKFKKYNQNNF
jgi:hypothetical protein